MIGINDRIKRKDTGSIAVSGDLIIVTPTYAWQIPTLVKEWLLQTTFVDVEHVWFVMNCGDSIGKADRYNQELCEKKNWTYMGTAQIVMPENYIAMFPVPDEKEAGKIIEAAEPAIEQAIKTMPNYFDEYDTTVTFISEEELKENHSKMPHGGFVIRTGETGTEGNKHVIEYSLKLDSNPEFTASVLVAYARAAYRLSQKGENGARSVFDIAPALLSQKTPEQLRAQIL